MEVSTGHMRRDYKHSDAEDDGTSSSGSRHVFAPFHAFVSVLLSLVSPSSSGAVDSAGDATSSPAESASSPTTDGGTERTDYADIDAQFLGAKRRIEQLLAAEEGYIQQSDLVARTRWSASTISRKLCEMESDGGIVRYQIGSRKVVIDTDRADISDVRFGE